MAKTNRENVPRVNFFDGQKVTEQDLDEEQIHHRSASSSIVRDFHGSGVIRDRLFESRILFDTSNPDEYSEDDDENSSKFIVEDGNYDGLGVYFDRQPSDNVYGNRLEIEASNISALGKITTKILIIGRSFNGIDDAGELVSVKLRMASDREEDCTRIELEHLHHPLGRHYPSVHPPHSAVGHFQVAPVIGCHLSVVVRFVR